MDSTEASKLRELHLRFGLDHIRHVMKLAGVKTVYRFTVYYDDFVNRHSAATLIDTIHEGTRLEVVYEGVNNHRPLVHPIPQDDFREFHIAIQKTKFATLGDQPDASLHSSSLALFEQAMGGFYHDILLLPDEPIMPYSVITNAIDAYLADAIRKVPR